MEETSHERVWTNCYQCLLRDITSIVHKQSGHCVKHLAFSNFMLSCLFAYSYLFQGKYMDLEFDYKGDPIGGVISNCKWLFTNSCWNLGNGNPAV